MGWTGGILYIVCILKTLAHFSMLQANGIINDVCQTAVYKEKRKNVRSQSKDNFRYFSLLLYCAACCFSLFSYCSNSCTSLHFNTLRTGDADLRFYITTVQDGWSRFAFLTRWNSVHLHVLLSATPQRGMFPEVSHPQALLGSLVSISWKFQFTKIVSEFVIN